MMSDTIQSTRKKSRVSDLFIKEEERKKYQEPLLASERIPEVDENDGKSPPPPQFIPPPSAAEKRTLPLLIGSTQQPLEE